MQHSDKQNCVGLTSATSLHSYQLQLRCSWLACTTVGFRKMLTNLFEELGIPAAFVPAVRQMGGEFELLDRLRVFPSLQIYVTQGVQHSRIVR